MRSLVDHSLLLFAGAICRDNRLNPAPWDRSEYASVEQGSGRRWRKDQGHGVWGEQFAILSRRLLRDGWTQVSRSVTPLDRLLLYVVQDNISVLAVTLASLSCTPYNLMRTH